MSETLIQAVLKTRDDFCHEWLDLDLYPYQRKFISDPVIESVLLGSGRRLYAEFPRQCGKTIAAAATALFLAFSWRNITGEPLRIGWFAPTKETTNIWFNSVKNMLTLAKLKGCQIETGISNSTTLELMGSTIKARTAGEGTNTKGETFHLIGTDETADIIDEKLEYDIKYMGAATNATYLHVGTPSYKMANRSFYEAISKGGPNTFILPFQEACAVNPTYAKYVENQDQETDDFKMMIGMQWILSSQFFVTPELLYKCRGDYPRVFDCRNEQVYAAVDWGKAYDSTVVTVFRKGFGRVEVLNWLELQGTNYADQVGIIVEFLGHYQDLLRVYCDSTGTQDQIVDQLRRAIRTPVMGVVFTVQSKHDMSVALSEAINNKWFAYPDEDCREARRFEKQLLNLVKEYKGNYMSVHAPEQADAHDDYFASVAMGVWGVLKQKEIPTIGGLG